MEYRIISDGTHFCVQRKFLFFFWRCPTEIGAMDHPCYAMYNTIEETKEYLERLKKRDIVCSRKWQVFSE